MYLHVYLYVAGLGNEDFSVSLLVESEVLTFLADQARGSSLASEMGLECLDR